MMGNLPDNNDASITTPVQEAWHDVFANLSGGLDSIVILSAELATLDGHSEHLDLLAVLVEHIKRLAIFESFAFYLLEDRFDFEMALCEPSAARQTLEQDVEQHIEKGTFAWVLNNTQPLVISGPVSASVQVMQALATRRRVHGMFIGSAKSGQNMSGITLNLLQVMLSLGNDALENIELQRQLQRHNDRLEEEVRHRTRELEVATKKAEESNRSKSAFLANMSHEIRTPMNGVLGMLELLRCGELSQSQREQVETAYRSGNYLLDLLNDILDLSKVEVGKLALEKATFNLHEVIKDLIGLFSAKASEKDLAFEMDIAQEVPEWVMGDRTRLWQVLGNLVGNALKFTERGRVVVKVSLEVRADEPTGLRFAISDTGIGIEEKALDKIFDSFEQADSSMVRRFGGTGLGLALSKRIVNLMGGNIRVSSVLGEGSCFEFMIVMQPAQAEAVANEVQASVVDTQASEHHETTVEKELSQPGLADAVVLLVEDNEVNQMVIEGMLKEVGVSVQIASNGVEALTAMDHGDFDLVLMDVQMPVMNGYETTRLIRLREGERKHTPIIALTANVLPEYVRQCSEAGMDDFLAKPVQLERFKQLLNKWIPPASHKRTGQPVAESALPLAPVLDMAVIDTLRDVLAESFGGIVKKFVAYGQGYIDAMRAGLDAVDAVRVRREAHTLKGSSGTMGASALARVCFELEQKAKTGNLTDANILIDDIEAHFKQASEALLALLQ